MLFAILPLAFVAGTGPAFVDSLTMLFAILPLALIEVASRVVVDSLTMLFIVLPLALIEVAIHVVKDSMTMSKSSVVGLTGVTHDITMALVNSIFPCFQRLDLFGYHSLFQ